jgi:K+-transporting ATPase ATPase A chain
MTLDYAIGLIVTVGLLVHSRTRCSGRRSSDMTGNGWLQILLFLAVVLVVTRPLGRFLTRVFSRERTWLDPVLRPVERLIYRTRASMTRARCGGPYATAMLLFSVVSMLVLYLIQRVQRWLPWNPQGFGAVAPDLAFNTAASSPPTRTGRRTAARRR